MDENKIAKTYDRMNRAIRDASDLLASLSEENERLAAKVKQLTAENHELSLKLYKDARKGVPDA